MARMRSLIVAAGLVLGTVGAAQGQNTCNGLLAIDYVSVQSPNTTGSIDRVRLSIGAGAIGGGNRLDVSRLFFNLDCKARVCSNATTNSCSTDSDCPGGTCLAILPACIDDGAVAGYVGNVTTTCPGITWTANSSGGAVPNKVTLTANAAVLIPESTFPHCVVEFDFIKLADQSNDSTPNTIEQVAGFDMAACNNGLAASSAISGAVGVAGVPDISVPVPAPTTSAVGAVLIALGLGTIGHRRLRRRSRAA